MIGRPREDGRERHGRNLDPMGVASSEYSRNRETPRAQRDMRRFVGRSRTAAIDPPAPGIPACGISAFPTDRFGLGGGFGARGPEAVTGTHCPDGGTGRHPSPIPAAPSEYACQDRSPPEGPDTSECASRDPFSLRGQICHPRPPVQNGHVQTAFGTYGALIAPIFDCIETKRRSKS